MQAAVYERFGGPIEIRKIADPVPPPSGVVVQVRATGVCRSDWHGWQGHDPEITLPHVPGHELSGVVVAVGREVRLWQTGDRVTVPFVCACGQCPECQRGNHQVCDNQSQPGFTHFGSFAEYVALDRADVNLVRLPEEMDFVTAASLGCRFSTAYRGVISQGRVQSGETVAVFGCGGVGLSAIMIAQAQGARIIAVDIDDRKLTLAKSLGAEITLKAGGSEDLPDRLRDATHGGADVSIDALGSPETCRDSILSLRKRGRHVQIGLLLADESRPSLPMDRVIAWELEILGSHGMSAQSYPEMLQRIISGRLAPEKLIGDRVPLAEGVRFLTQMDRFPGIGVTVIDQMPSPES